VAPRITLIERRATVWMFLLGVACVAAVWVAEAAFGQVAAYDRLAYPVLLGGFAVLGTWVWRRPQRAPVAQGLGSMVVAGYFVCAIAYGLLVTTHEYTVYQLGTMAFWVMGGHLLFFITWTPGRALGLSVVLALATLAPALWIKFSGQPAPPDWQDVLWPLFVNGFVAQAFFMLAMYGATLQFRKLLLLTPAQATPTETLTVDDVVSLRMRHLEEARDAAEAASQAKSRFLAVMSHELRTPLHGVLGAAELLRQPGLPPDQRMALVDTVSRGGTHLLSLINDVLDLSRIEAGRMDLDEQPYDLHECITRALEAVQTQAAAKGLALHHDISSEVPQWVLGDDFRLRQVLINLLGNAVKFTDTGSVSLHAYREDGADGRRGALVLQVVDTGIGIAEADLARVFEAFQQADSESTRRHGGTGLGLAIARQLVTMMRGQLDLKSQVGQGTQVVLRLPVQETRTPDVRSSSAMSLNGALEDLAGVRLLLVDDDPVNTMIAEQMLVHMNAQVDVAHSGVEALERLNQSRYDAVLMDWRMPGMDGLETTRCLRRGVAGEAARHVPVIGLTANAYNEDRVACLRAGMDDVLVKPVNKLQLRLAVQRQLAASS
jgi:signal transduction histidine kinase/ActR/RegA family two-component response regulator